MKVMMRCDAVDKVMYHRTKRDDAGREIIGGDGMPEQESVECYAVHLVVIDSPDNHALYAGKCDGYINLPGLSAAAAAGFTYGQDYNVDLPAGVAPNPAASGPGAPPADRADPAKAGGGPAVADVAPHA